MEFPGRTEYCIPYARALWPKSQVANSASFIICLPFSRDLSVSLHYPCLSSFPTSLFSPVSLPFPRDSSVGKATDYGLESPGPSPGSERTSLLHSVLTDPGAHPASNGYRKCLRVGYGGRGMKLSTGAIPPLSHMSSRHSTEITIQLTHFTMVCFVSKNYRSMPVLWRHLAAGIPRCCLFCCFSEMCAICRSVGEVPKRGRLPPPSARGLKLPAEGDKHLQTHYTRVTSHLTKEN
jgi:hypothetical protein